VRLLLISNSTNTDGGYLDHVTDTIVTFLGDADHVLFLPFAMHDIAGYGKKTCARLNEMGIECRSAPDVADWARAVKDAGAIFVGGGNTFRLLNVLRDSKLLAAIHNRVENGLPYMGASAGANVACPTIRTTNDMPIVQPRSFKALNLVPFNINPHYIDRDPDFPHQGESRELRIQEFHEENSEPVIGLREGSFLTVEGSRMQLDGSTGARLFRRDKAPKEVAPGTYLDFLLGNDRQVPHSEDR